MEVRVIQDEVVVATVVLLDLTVLHQVDMVPTVVKDVQGESVVMDLGER